MNRTIALCATVAALWVAACAERQPPASGAAPAASQPPVAELTNVESLVLQGVTIAGGKRADVEIREGKVVAIGDVAEGTRTIDYSGRWLVPAFIDSHVHFAYLPKTVGHAVGGIVAAVDLAAPIAFLSSDDHPLTVLASGPMLTAPRGYPTQSWGADGYGLEVSTPTEARAAVRRLAGKGAALIKVAIEPGLDDATLRAITSSAHERGLRVAAHALTGQQADRAARADIDVLAHTPLEPLSEEQLAAWAGRAVMTTLAAFGGRGIENLKRLRAQGTRVLYGTDFGNLRETGVSGAEIEALLEAGFDGAAIVQAATRTPARYWKLDELGTIAVGKSASFLVLDADPLESPKTLAAPAAVYLHGVRQ